MHFPEQSLFFGRLSGADARLKLAAALVLLGMVLSSTSMAFPFLVAGLSPAFCLLRRVPARSLLLRYSEPLFIAAVLIALKTLFSGAQSLVSVRIAGMDLVVHADGLREGLLIGGRIMGSVGIMTVLGYSTPFSELLSALSWYRVPKGLVEVLFLAYRYIFLLFEEAYTIYHAQKNRLGYATIGRGFRSFGVLAGSLTIKAFEHSQNTALAMAQRGYDGSMPAGRLRPFRVSEVAISACFILIAGVLWKLP